VIEHALLLAVRVGEHSIGVLASCRVQILVDCNNDNLVQLVRRRIVKDELVADTGNKRQDRS